MSKTARRARIAAIIELLCDRFPQTFSRRDARPLKIGVHADLLAALDGAVEPRNLKSALAGYTSSARYLRTLSAGASRIDLDGKPAGTVAPEVAAVAKVRLAELAKGTPPRAKVPLVKGPEPDARTPTAETPKPPAPKRLSLADLREAGRRRREDAA
jgi:ProP effector